MLSSPASCSSWSSQGRTRLFGQGLDYVKANYTKFEYRIPMRDGIHLFTSVYVPKDQSQPYPIMLSRTPYSVQPYGTDDYKSDLGPSPLFGKDGYIVVYQDVRGRWMSEGEFVNMRPHRPQKTSPQEIDESSDTFDTIDWLLKNVPGNNGRVGLWGISYPGFYTAAGMIDAHPALKAASPQAPVTDWFAGDDWHHNGAFLLPHAFNFLVVFRPPAPRADQEISRASRLRHARRIRASSCGWGRSRTSTRGTSRTTFRSGTRSCSTGLMMNSGKPATFAPT